VKGKLGITDAQIRDFDDAMRDYALKYDTACRDFIAQPPRISPEEYDCRRRNMDTTLDRVRQLVAAVRAAKDLPDASTQRDVILSALSTIKEAEKSSYRSGCAVTLDVNPRSLFFQGNIVQLALQLSNRGSRRVAFSVEYPDGFVPLPLTGHLDPGGNTPVVIYRTNSPVSAQKPLKIWVRTTFQDDREIDIRVDEENGKVFPRLAAELKQQSGAEPKLEDALALIQRDLPAKEPPKAADYVLAATLLYEFGSLQPATSRSTDGEAKKAIATALATDTTLARPAAPLIAQIAARDVGSSPSGGKEPLHAAGGIKLGEAELSTPTVADGKTLPAGRYDVWVTELAPGRGVGHTASFEGWAEFRGKDGTVHGRELVNLLPQFALNNTMKSPLGTAKVEMLRGNDNVRVFFQRPDYSYLIHLPPAVPQK
jgi:hypothetical protein